jgi:dTDP-L-rhamnose 4-epimerase
MALENDEMNYEVFNVGGGHTYTVQEFAEIVRREVQKHKRDPLPEPDVPKWYRFGDTRNACSDISKIKALGWEPHHTPSESVREYVGWLYEQDNVEDIMEYAMKTMKEMNVVRPVGS